MTFTKYGLTDFDVEYWDGSGWQLVPGGMVAGNNKVWRRLDFAPVTTTKLRVMAKGALAFYSRVAEVEVYYSAFHLSEDGVKLTAETQRARRRRRGLNVTQASAHPPRPLRLCGEPFSSALNRTPK